MMETLNWLKTVKPGILNWCEENFIFRRRKPFATSLLLAELHTPSMAVHGVAPRHEHWPFTHTELREETQGPSAHDPPVKP
mmetsp:Transcript_31452/g.90241  ORF Transcript_31452/g.90241 Transcript_31452/m.90241 type:complete len:81 (-) Transcript_31452:186-428(-)